MANIFFKKYPLVKKVLLLQFGILGGRSER